MVTFILFLALAYVGYMTYKVKKEMVKIKEAQATLVANYDADFKAYHSEQNRLREIQVEVAKGLAAVNGPDAGGL